uniref:tRNA (guanine(37)-N1)-methyltransferase n=1 Tax=Physcomitrium patens TaxID=3218 RepID=A0A7I4B948_PHYPA
MLGIMAAPGCSPVGIDKSAFVVRLPRVALRIPKQKSHRVASLLSKYLLDMPRVKHIVEDPQDPSMRLLLFSEAIAQPDLEGVSEEKILAVKEIVPLDVVQHEVVLDYSYWPVEHILKEILPAGCHIAHLNLREDLLTYKKIIAEVILDKNPKLKTVVNKVGTITNEFRVPEFEILAGEPSLVTEIKQHGATFRLDYGMVYWNSRLEGEHKRLFAQFKPGQVIVDMFAGIGPFAIPAAQQGCAVYANDLNPTSVKFLKLNSDINKVGESIKAFNLDAREFMRKLVTEEEGCVGEIASSTLIAENSLNGTRIPSSKENSSSLTEGSDMPSSKKPEERKAKKAKVSEVVKMKISDVKPWEHFDHVVMNLPASALEFLDVLNGLLCKGRWKGTMPRVHCYCFMRSNETNADIVKKAETYLGGSIADPDVYVVRDVAPNKIMLCVSFNLPEEVAIAVTATEPAALDQNDALSLE